LQIDDLHVWRIGDQRYAAIIGLAAASESSIMMLRQALQRHHQLVHLTIDQI
jgi:hypothetical protein